MDPILAQRSWFLSSTYGFCLKPYTDFFAISKWKMVPGTEVCKNEGCPKFWQFLWKMDENGGLSVYHILSPRCGSKSWKPPSPPSRAQDEFGSRSEFEERATAYHFANALAILKACGEQEAAQEMFQVWDPGLVVWVLWVLWLTIL